MSNRGDLKMVALELRVSLESHPRAKRNDYKHSHNCCPHLVFFSFSHFLSLVCSHQHPKRRNDYPNGSISLLRNHCQQTGPKRLHTLHPTTHLVSFFCTPFTQNTPSSTLYSFKMNMNPMPQQPGQPGGATPDQVALFNSVFRENCPFKFVFGGVTGK